MAQDKEMIEELYAIHWDVKTAEKPHHLDLATSGDTRTIRVQAIQAYWLQRIFEVLNAIEMDLRKGTRP